MTATCSVWWRRRSPRTGRPGRRTPGTSLTILAPVLAPPTVLCVATNYQEHIVEGGGDRVDPTRVSPKLFMKPPASVIGDGATYEIPEISAAADWEAELCVVIGSGGRGDRRGSAPWTTCSGYAASNDISLRKLAVDGFDRDVNAWAGFFDWLEGKWSDGAAPIGPWLTTADEVPDPQALWLRTWVSRGAPAGRDHRRHDPRRRRADRRSLSTMCTLEPGDIYRMGHARRRGRDDRRRTSPTATSWSPTSVRSAD